MFVEKFIKKAYISFYKNKKYHLFCEIKKNKKIIEILKKDFDEKKYLEKEILNIQDDYAQYYISTIIDTINQGIIPTCEKKEMKNYGIDVENINYICIKNYSIYASLYDIVTIKKNYKFNIDFLYSLFAPIDFFAKKRNNYLYVLILNEKIALVAYKNNKPLYCDIEVFKEEDEEYIEPIDELEIENDDLSEEISESIEEEAKNINLEEPEIEKSNIEFNIIEKIKNFIKEYYENYSDEFIEKIIFLDTVDVGDSLKKIVNDELLLESEIIKFDLLKILNQISERENV